MLELEKRIKSNSKEGHIQLMTHAVIGYPSLEKNFKVIEKMAAAGVELIELQIPFSEPMADGPTIVRANSQALKEGIKISDCFDFAAECVKAYPSVSFLFMSYLNPIYRYGLKNFVKKSRSLGICGTIIPDFPAEYSQEYRKAAEEEGLAAVNIFAPTTSDERMRELSSSGSGMIYCMGRVGVTGKQTAFGEEFENYIGRCGRNSDLPLGVGFGIRQAEDIDYLRGKVEIAVIGSRLIEILEENDSVEEIEGFLKSLRNAKI